MSGPRTPSARPVAGLTIDLDDTLYPQAEHLAGAFDAVAARAALRGVDAGALRAALDAVAGEGSDRGGVIDRALAAVAADASGDTGFVRSLVAAFLSYAPDTLTPYPGVLDALAEVRRLVPVVVVTDGSPSVQRGKIAALGLGPLVDGVVVSDELDRALRKPHPAPFRRALSLLGLPAGIVVHVGDRPGKDTAGAARVGMRAVRVHTGEYADVPDDPLVPPWRTAPDAATALRDLLPLLRPIRSRTAADAVR